AGGINCSEAAPRASAQQIPMDHTVASRVPSHDVAARVDVEGRGTANANAGEINQSKAAPRASAQQVPMVDTGYCVASHDVAARGNPGGRGAIRTCGAVAYFKGREFAPAQQVAMKSAIRAAVPSRDVAARVDGVGRGQDSAGEIKRSEFAPAPQIAMAHAGSVVVGARDIAARVDPLGKGKGRAGEIN